MSIPSGYLCEYGTLALIFAALGYLCRHRPVLTWIKTRDLTIAYALFAGAAFVGFQQLYFHFDLFPFLFMTGGTAAVMVALLFFRPMTFPSLTRALTPVLAAPVQLMGRHTLAIYVIHLLAFKAAAMILFPDRFQFLDWSFLIRPER